MRPRPRPLLVLGFVVALAAVYRSQNPPSPMPSRALKEAAAHLRGYHQPQPDAAGWEVAGVSTGPGIVRVDVRIPERTGTPPGNNRYTGTTARLRPFCPPRSDIAWKLLLPDQDIEVRAVNPGGEVSISISCRVANSRRGNLPNRNPSLAEQFLHRAQGIG